MDDVYNSFVTKKPKCFQKFDLDHFKAKNSNWVTGPEFLSKLLRCSCGNDKLDIYTSSGEGMLLAPIVIECPVCHYRAELFHPEKYGWDGENGDNCSLVGTTPVEKVNDSPTRVVVEYSYQGKENYQDLIEDGIDNPEDYFDVFAVFTVDDSDRLKEVVSYECA